MSSFEKITERPVESENADLEYGVNKERKAERDREVGNPHLLLASLPCEASRITLVPSEQTGEILQGNR